MRVQALKLRGDLSKRLNSAEGFGEDEGDETEKRHGVSMDTADNDEGWFSF